MEAFLWQVAQRDVSAVVEAGTALSWRAPTSVTLWQPTVPQTAAAVPGDAPVTWPETVTASKRTNLVVALTLAQKRTVTEAAPDGSAVVVLTQPPVEAVLDGMIEFQVDPLVEY